MNSRWGSRARTHKSSMQPFQGLRLLRMRCSFVSALKTGPTPPTDSNGGPTCQALSDYFRSFHRFQMFPYVVELVVASLVVVVANVVAYTFQRPGTRVAKCILMHFLRWGNIHTTSGSKGMHAQTLLAWEHFSSWWKTLTFTTLCVGFEVLLNKWILITYLYEHFADS